MSGRSKVTMNRREFNQRLRFLLSREHAERMQLLAAMGEEEQREFRWVWRIHARNAQVAPDGDWRTWLILAGRGFGKTRAGAEWVRELAEADPAVRIALVGATLGEARSVMVEGESGLLAVCPPGRKPAFEPSLRRLTWPNGAEATLYSAGEPESLRGPQHGYARRASPKGRFRQ
jgi:phage terminase large subunit-like protein